MYIRVNSSTKEDVMKHVDTVVNNIPVAGNRVSNIKFATANDKDFCWLQDIILMGGLTTNPSYQQSYISTGIVEMSYL